ncbi:zf-HC2 domain-containing protein [uncultured Tessaracoccus sp.]|uniref:zf-HC2 domain-containing protein n=1 Tax=uncultured Tessaracoccus sp. TaxID=905023 RepID=UPI0025EFCDF9|nr:zf-HC2 domain-containing protein [uncultured Tessaracoccus sp.]
MSEPLEHDEIDECVLALQRVHAFLHHELDDADADEIRHHLHACERCMEQFEIESAIDTMLRRQPCVPATAELRLRVQRLRIRRG